MLLDHRSRDLRADLVELEALVALNDRQYLAALDGVADGAQVVLVVGSQNSSNSQRLVDVARAGGADAYLIDNAGELNPEWLVGRTSVALTAGASAPEELVSGVAERIAGDGWKRGGHLIPTDEGVVFALPAELRGLTDRSG